VNLNHWANPTIGPTGEVGRAGETKDDTVALR
jgi:hypothetical protein